MNNVNLVGRLVKDVKIHISDKGTNVGYFTVAVNRPFAKDGQQEADFINCVAFNNTALNLNEYCKKGSLISLTGKVQSFSFDDENNERQFGMNIVADNIEYLMHTDDNNKTEKKTEPKTEKK